METKNTESEYRKKVNEMERNTSNTSNASMSIELLKKIFRNMFKEEEEKLLKIARNTLSKCPVEIRPGGCPGG